MSKSAAAAVEASKGLVSGIYEKGPKPDGEQGQGHADDGVVIDSAERRQEIRACFERMKTVESERKACNEDIKAEMERLESLGINRQAAKLAFKRWKMDEEQREAVDVGYRLACKALSIEDQIALPFADSPAAKAR